MNPNELQVIADRIEIEDVLTRYCTALDSRRWDLLSEVFAPDGVAEFGDLGGRHEGPAAIGSFVASVLAGLDASQHLLGNEVVRVSGDRAEATCYFQAQHFLVSPNGGNTYLVGGTYDDELVRTPAGWRITLRRLTPTWYDGNAGVFTDAAARLADQHS
jgi:hypothetical protein